MLTGRCQCGAVRYQVDADPIRTYCCHCTECRAQSASAFGISVIVPPAAVSLTRGEVRTWTRPTGSGKRLECAFCPDCGTRIWHVNEPRGETMSIKGGSLDHPVDLTNAAHIWVAEKLPGIVIPDHVRTWNGEPD
ncbi:GFA family protein (plasmid) [Paracoccus sp. TK19116]|uniref:GFA family protein n=1 Tax=Paracoccus albicereus TaxID=2922394 RepID=A0ABT1MKW7_9RHOB|nr:GFA family protein [Paracoccus albicereus]MCQ0968937.1 GFA family protein [Paracoccus albicereus]